MEFPFSQPNIGAERRKTMRLRLLDDMAEYVPPGFAADSSPLLATAQLDSIRRTTEATAA
jgi:hypothetical protein